jgi:hypothetical protein
LSEISLYITVQVDVTLKFIKQLAFDGVFCDEASETLVFRDDAVWEFLRVVSRGSTLLALFNTSLAYEVKGFT